MLKALKAVRIDMSGRGSPRAAHPEQGFNSQLVVSIVFSAKAITRNVLALVLLCIWLLCSNIWALKSSSWQATLRVTTKRQESFPVTFSWLSVMTRSWTNCSPGSPSHREVFFPTSRPYFCLRRLRRNPRPKSALTRLKTAPLGATKYYKSLNQLNAIKWTWIKRTTK